MRIEIGEGNLRVHLRPLERLAAFHGDILVPLASVTNVEVLSNPPLRGVRAPGTWVPGLLSYGTYRHRGGKDFVAMRRGVPVLRVSLSGQVFTALVIGTPDAEALAARLREAAPSRR
jgi:hypothetical protein